MRTKEIKENSVTKPIYPQGTFTCPICKKEFEADDNTRFIISGGYTCSWKCFSNEVKKRGDMKNKR